LARCEGVVDRGRRIANPPQVTNLPHKAAGLSQRDGAALRQRRIAQAGC